MTKDESVISKLPINTASIVSMAVILVSAWFAGYIFNNIQQGNKERSEMLASLKYLAIEVGKNTAAVRDNMQGISSIRETRFTEKDSAALTRNIMAEIHTVIAPLQSAITILQSNVERLNQRPPCQDSAE